MLTRFLLLSALACGQVLAQDAKPPTPPAEPPANRSDCMIGPMPVTEANASKPCEIRMSQAAAMPAPDKLLAADPPGAGPRPAAPTRSQVVDEIGRARLAGELDWAAMEAGLDAPRRATRR